MASEGRADFITCHACGGTGWWHAQAVKGKGVHYERQRLPCLACDGGGLVFCEIESTADRSKRMARVSAGWWGKQ